MAHGKKQAEKRTEKQKPGVGKSYVSVGQTDTENQKGPMWEPHTTGSPEKSLLHSISRVGEPKRPSTSDTEQAA